MSETEGGFTMKKFTVLTLIVCLSFPHWVFRLWLETRDFWDA